MSMPQEDIVAGRVFRAKRKTDGSPMKFFYVAVYEVDAKTGKPVQDGTKKLGKETVPTFKIARFYRIAESSLMKVASGASGACNLYFKPYTY